MFLIQNFRLHNYFEKLILSFLIIFYFTCALGVILSDEENNAGYESNVIYTIESMILGQELYSDPEMIPFAVTQYMPFSYSVYYSIIKTFDFKVGKNTYEIIVGSRFISFFFSLILFASIFFTQKFTLDVKNKIALWSTILISFITLPWYLVARPDVFVSSFLFLSVLFVLMAFKVKKDSIYYFTLIILSGIFISLTFLSKQNGIVNIFILLSFFFFTKNWKVFFTLFTGVLITFFVFIFLVKDWSIINFYKNIILGVSNGINIHLFVTKAIIPYITQMLIFSALAIYFFYKNHLQKNVYKDVFYNFLFYFFTAQLLFAILFALKEGSAKNYFFDTTIFAVLFVSYYLKFVDLKLNSLMIFISYILIFQFCFSLGAVNFFEYSKPGIEVLSNRRPNRWKEKNALVHFIEKEIKVQPDLLFITRNRYLKNLFPNNAIFPQDEIVDPVFPVNSGFYHNKVFVYSELRNLYDSGRLRFIIFQDHNSKDWNLNGFAGLNTQQFTFYTKIEDFDIYLNPKDK